jgi:rod shape-determining protein MreC
VGAILDKSRLQGVVKGTAAGEVILENVMTDESVAPGERVVTSGGDQIFPKGLTVGTVMKVSPGADLFLNIRVTPSANLSRLEEVLVITKTEDRSPAVAETGSRVRAVDILTQRLPSVPDKPTIDTSDGTASGAAAAEAATPKARNTPNAALPVSTKPSQAGVKPAGVKPASDSTATPPKGQTAKPKPAEDQPH